MSPRPSLLLLAALLGVAAGAAPATDDSVLRTQVIQTIQAMFAAEERLDAAAVWSVHADVPGYRWVDIDGTAHDFTAAKKVWTDYLAGCARLQYTTLREDVLVLGSDLAFYTWTGSADVTPTEGPRTRNDLWTARYLCRRIDGAWKIIGGQESSSPGKPVMPAAVPVPPGDQELVAQQKRWGAALVQRDLATLDEILADEWISVDPTGRMGGKAGLLDAVRGGHYVATQFACGEVKARVFGDTGIVNARSIVEARYDGTECGGTLLFTDTWLRRDGRWRCVASHATQLAPPPPTSAPAAAPAAK